MKIHFKLVVLISLLIVASCGGGNNASNNRVTGSRATPGAAQGVYQGTTSNNYAFEGIVLPNDKLYAIYGTKDTNGFLVYGLMIGQGTSMSDGKFNGTYMNYTYTGTSKAGTLNGNYAAGNLSGSYTENGSTYTLTSSAMSSTEFNYNTPSSLSQLAGIWAGTALDGTAESFTVNADGSFSGSVEGCTVTGTAVPDSAKNFFNITVNFGSSPCGTPNQSATGIALTYLQSDGVHRQLLVAASNNSMATLFIAER